MNQNDLILRLQMNLSNKFTVSDLDLILESLKKTIIDSTSNGEVVSIKNFGRFIPRMLKGKTLNKTGITWTKDKAYKIPDRVKLGFRSSPLADEQVNKLTDKLNGSTGK